MRIRLTCKVDARDWQQIVIDGLHHAIHVKGWANKVKFFCPGKHSTKLMPRNVINNEEILDALRYKDGALYITDEFKEVFEIDQDVLEKAVNDFIKLAISNERSLFYVHGGEMRFEVSQLTETDCDIILQLACYGSVVH